MARRLLLLAETSHEAAWSRANGQESAVRVRGLGEGKAWLEIELEPEGRQRVSLTEGLTSLLDFVPKTWARYRAVKQANGRLEVTSVEVIFG